MSALRLLCAAMLIALVGTIPVPASAAAPGSGVVTVVQAVPDRAVTVSIDGQRLGVNVGLGVLDPLEVAPGRHVARFRDDSGAIRLTAEFRVEAGERVDVVLHQPAAVGQSPVVSTYGVPLGAIGPGKSRVVVAHTATVAPADVRVDGRTIFTNIANSEFAEAEVPAGPHEVALFPTGRQGAALLGPLTFRLEPRTVTMVYAVGDPADASMQLISHSTALTPGGPKTPETIRTGSAGLAAGTAVSPFSGQSSADVGTASARSGYLLLLLLGGLLATLPVAGRSWSRAAASGRAGETG